MKLSLDIFNKLSSENKTAVLCAFFLAHMTEKKYKYIGHYSDASDSCAIWIDLRKLKGASELGNYEALNTAICDIVDTISFENLKLEHSISTEDLFDSFYPSLSFETFENDLIAIDRDLTKLINVLDTITVIPPTEMKILTNEDT